MKLGIALSLYDKIDQLRTNVSIIRNHWNSNTDSYISVCCNNPDMMDEISNLKIDNLVPGDDIEYVDKPSRRMRIINCIQKSVMACEAEYIVHYHSDAYAVSVEPILEIIEEMEKNQYLVAFRGKGLEYRNPKNFSGDVDDHYIVFKRSSLIERGVLDLNLSEMKKFLQVGNPETLLGFVITHMYKPSEIFHYDNMSKNKVHPSCHDDENYYGDKIRHRHMNPYNIDKERGFYHIGDSNLIFNMLSEAGVDENNIFFKNTNSEETHINDWLNE